MPADFPYMNSSGNVGGILDRIVSAGTPPRFTLEFLTGSLGFASSNDRGIIKVLKQLGFLNNDGSPTQRYNEFRHPDRSGIVLAEGLRDGWSEIFLADTNANDRSVSQLAGTFGSVTGKSDSVAQKMASTFKALAEKADFESARSPDPTDAIPPADILSERAPVEVRPSPDGQLPPSAQAALSLHHDIHVHLPATTDVAVYTAIFRALRNELVD